MTTVEEPEPEEIHARDLWQIAQFLGPYLRQHSRQLLLLGLVLLVETVINFCFPLATQYLVDEGLIQHNIEVLTGILIFLGVAATIAALLGLVLDYVNALIFSQMVLDIRQRLFAHLQSLSMPFFTRTQAGRH